MERFFSVTCQHADPDRVITECLDKLTRSPPGANFGFIYVTDAMAPHYGELLNRCKIQTGIKHWVGTTGVGIIGNDLELYDQPAASLMLAGFETGSFRLLPLVGDREQLDAIRTSENNFETSFGIIHGDPTNPETQQLISDLQAALPNGFLVGGLTSSRGDHLQVADNLVSGGVSGVIFSEAVNVLTNLTQGCSPLGNKHRITRSRENVAFTLDDKPALDVLMQDFNINTLEELNRQASNIFTGLCIAGSDRSDYRVRNLVGADFENRVFAINDYLQEGEELLFCTRSEETAVRDMRQMLEKLASRLDAPPKGGIYVSCLGRGREQFGDDSEEIRMIHQTLGDFPLTGFFANGEIHHDTLYGYTGVLVLYV